MHLQLLVLTSIFVTGILATPLTTHQANVGPNPQTKYVELYRENAFASGSYLIYYGTDSETPAERNNTKKCRASCTSKGTVACSTKNTTRSDTCNSLMQELKQDLRVSVPGSPHRVCYLGNGEVNQNCCISWTKPVPGLKKGDLYTVAYNMFNQCAESGGFGKTSRVTINHVCLNMCLSNRGTHCSKE